MLNQELIKNARILIPSKLEQTAIANYLDEKTSEIDQTIADKEELIKLYEEEKKALINEAVTKGLNPNVKLKSSGIDWLGDIPEHWFYASIKRVVDTKVTDGPHESPEFLEYGVPFVSAEAIKENKIDFNSCRGYISIEQDEIYSKKCKPKIGDILLVKSGSTTGKSAIVETDLNFNIWSPLALIRANEKIILYKNLHYSILSEQFRNLIELFWSFGTQPNIGMNVIENLKIAIPPIEEQTQIVDYIERESNLINEKTNTTQQEIALLKEYRQALIFEAVTGKICVI
jgi:type I restriction enzyme S subunit